MNPKSEALRNIAEQLETTLKKQSWLPDYHRKQLDGAYQEAVKLGAFTGPRWAGMSLNRVFGRENKPIEYTDVIMFARDRGFVPFGETFEGGKPGEVITRISEDGTKTLLRVVNEGEDHDIIERFALDLIEILRQESDAMAEPQEAGTMAEPPAITKKMRLVILSLNKMTSLATAQQVADGALSVDDTENLSERTARDCINQLISNGYAERPEGKNNGARLTLPGRKLAEKLSKAGG